MSIGEKIKQLRENSGLSQEELAKNLKITQQSVDAWERSIANPRKNNIDKLAHFFNVEAGFFFSNTSSSNNTLAPNNNLITSNDEKIILDKYRQLDEKAKQRVLRMVNGEYEDMIADKNKIKEREIS